MTKKSFQFSGFVERVVDGDTLRVACDLGFKIFFVVIVRLERCNAPELSTKAGQDAKKLLEQILPQNTKLVLTSNAIDRYGRSLGEVVRADDKFNVNDFLAAKFPL